MKDDDKKIEIVKDKDGNERRVITFRADPVNLSFKITPLGKKE